MVCTCTSSIPKEEVVCPRPLESNSRGSDTCLLCFHMSSALSAGLPSLFSALLDMLLALAGLSPALPDTSRPVITTHSCTPSCHFIFYIHLDYLRVLAGMPEGHCVSPVHSGIRPLSDSGVITSNPSQRLTVTKIHFADTVLKY